MIRAALVSALALLPALPLAAPTPASAQGSASPVQVNPAYVAECLRNAGPGDIAPRCLGHAAKLCQQQPGGDTTIGISECLQSEAAAWDGYLNRAYGTLRAAYRRQGGGMAEALLKAQRAWIGFRDAQCALDYARWGDGSMRTIAAANCQMTMTAGRAIDLRDMETGK